MARQFPVIVLTGPRQSGKTTLAKAVFPKHRYVSLEALDTREFAIRDPRGFLAEHRGRVVIDEAQRAPGLLSYLQGAVDDDPTPGRYILTGSQQFQLLAGISQSLAGRAGYLRLLPLSLCELRGAAPQDAIRLFDAPAQRRPAGLELESILFAGLYPRIHDQRIDARDFLEGYLSTYVERDVREVLQVGDLMTFGRFVQLCAGRSGQLLDYSALASDCGISHTTARRWLSVLEASAIVHIVEPYFRNFSKRIIKSPKLFFVDPGLMCHLLRIRSAQEVALHPLYGSIFETFVASELLKAFAHRGERPPLYFWRDRTGHEVDLLLDSGTRLTAIEAKGGRTIASDYFEGLKRFAGLEGARADGVLVYAGEQGALREGLRVRTWWQVS